MKLIFAIFFSLSFQSFLYAQEYPDLELKILHLSRKVTFLRKERDRLLLQAEEEKNALFSSVNYSIKRNANTLNPLVKKLSLLSRAFIKENPKKLSKKELQALNKQEDDFKRCYVFIKLFKYYYFNNS